MDLNHLVELGGDAVRVVFLDHHYLRCLLLDGVAIIIELFFFLFFFFVLVVLGLLFLRVNLGFLLDLSVIRIIDVVDLNDSVWVFVRTPDAEVSVLASRGEVLVVVL